MLVQMIDPDNLDFKELGFHAGLEVHHQIRTKRKLFCNCPPILEEDPENMEYSFYRYFRPVLGEMGDFDPGMLVEFEKGYKVIYLANEKNTCTYEMDETPPFFPDMEAIEKGIILSAYFDCSAYAEEVVVNRKQYLDGSITTGFQRTFISARDGWVPVNGKKVRITNVHIEEDAARRVNWDDTSSRTVYFNLDRLGMPLTEIITEYTDVDTPEELIETAKQIGRVLRISKIGIRGLGAARQDVNISITGGDRVELKGVQNLDHFDIMCRHEVVRQYTLIEIKEEMLKREIKEEDFEHTYVDISHLFNDDKKYFASIFPKMKGLFGLEVQPNKDFGEEIFEKSMLITGLPRANHFHSDELDENAVRKRSKYPSSLPINNEVITKIFTILNPKESDALIIIAGPEKSAIHAMKKVVERVKMALKGVPQETRRYVYDGNSEFLRVIHGKDRIYPDTDTPPVVISLEKIFDIIGKIGKRPWEVYVELNEKYQFDQNHVDLLIRDEKLDKFYNMVDDLGLDEHLTYRLLIDLPREKRRKNIKITEKLIEKLALLFSNNTILLEQLELVLPILLENPNISDEELKVKIGFKEITSEQLDKIIDNQIKLFGKDNFVSSEDKKRNLPRIVNQVLNECNYSIKGEQVANKINSLLKEVI